jgi:hypothetical protein
MPVDATTQDSSGVGDNIHYEVRQDMKYCKDQLQPELYICAEFIICDC